MGYAVVILSKTASKLEKCIAAVRQNENDPKIIVVDDGVDWKGRDWGGVVSVLGKKPFIFARNANIGIRAAGKRDVVLLNDDALLKSRGGFTAMQRAVEEHPEYAIIGATCNNIGQRSQFPQGVGLRDEPRMVCFVCVYIPRTTIESVGLLDERYEGYGMDDDDYCLRVREAGLKIGIHDSCFVDHATLESDYRGRGGGDYSGNLALFKEKWGIDQMGRKV